MKNEMMHKRIEFDNIRSLIAYGENTYGNDTAFSYKNSPFEKENIKKATLTFKMTCAL